MPRYMPRLIRLKAIAKFAIAILQYSDCFTEIRQKAPATRGQRQLTLQCLLPTPSRRSSGSFFIAKFAIAILKFRIGHQIVVQQLATTHQ